MNKPVGQFHRASAQAPPNKFVARIWPKTLPKPAEVSAIAQETACAPKEVELKTVVEIFVWIMHQPEKFNPCYAFVGNPRNNYDCGQRVTIGINRAHWPTAGAIERRDWRALRWLCANALLERLSLCGHSVFRALRWKLVADALGQQAQIWESVAWAAYRLKDATLFAELEGIVNRGDTNAPSHRLVSVEVRVEVEKLQRYNQQKKKGTKS